MKIIVALIVTVVLATGCAQQKTIEENRAILVDPDATSEERDAAWEEIQEAEGQIDTIATTAGAAAAPLIPPPWNLLISGIAGLIAVAAKGSDQ